MSRISRIIKNSIFVLPMIMCLFAFGSGQKASANNVDQVKINSLLNQGLTHLESNQKVNAVSDENNLISQQNKGDSKSADIGFGFIFNNSFGVHIDGCYYQVEQIIDGLTGHLYCGTLIVFCENSVEIYTGGSNCS